MKSNWQIRRIGDVMQVERGGSPRPIKKYLTSDPNGLNWIKISDATASTKYIYETREKITKAGLHKTRVVNEGDFILSNSMSFGRPYIMKTSGCIHDGWLVLRDKEEFHLDKDFLYYLLSSPYIFQQFDNLAAGSTVRNLNIGLVSEVEIPIPPSQEQKRIVKILDEVFAKTAKAKENAEKNLQNAHELFESYLQSVFANPGYGWEEKKIGDIADIEYGFTDKATDSGDYRYVRITDIDNNGNLRPEDKVFVRSSSEAKKFLLKDGDLLMARTGATYAKVLFYEGVEQSVFASYLIRIGFKEKIANKLYWYFSKSGIYWKQANQMSSGSAQPQFNGNALKELIFYFPKSYDEQKSIVAKFDALSAEVKKLESIYQQKLADLEELKKSVLQKAFNGELSEASA